MALDEVLLNACRNGHAGPTLRLYTWQSATLSLGYFQPLAQAAPFAQRHGLPIVRRQTGGGAIVHQNELTYSLVLPVDPSIGGFARQVYQLMDRALIQALKQFDVRAEMRGCGSAAEVGSPLGLLCFGRTDPHDLVVAGHKVAGSAQRRSRGALLQHGSLLLAAADAAPEAPGLAELTGRPLDSQDVLRVVAAEVARAGPWTLETGALTPTEEAAVAGLVRERYAHPAWAARR